MSSSPRYSYRIKALILSLILLFSSACAEQVGDIDRTQPNQLKKSDFQGVWHFVRTVTGVPYGVSFAFVGEMSFGSNPKIMWDIQEKHLIAYPVYETLEGAEMGFHSKKIRKYWDLDAIRDDNPDNDFIDLYVGQPISAFRIESHFDVSRKYNAQTGEQSNVLEENTYDRPWYEREFIRVDWSMDSVSDFQFAVGNMSTTGTPYYVQDMDDPNNPDLPEFDEGYIGIVLKLFAQPQSSGQCSIYTLASGDCAGGVVKARYSYKRVNPVPTYDPKRWHNSFEMDKFGFFQSERYTYDDDTGLTYSGRDQKAGRWNLWDQVWEFQDLEGEARTCVMDADCDREAGEFCYQEEWFVDGYCRGRKLLRPSERYQNGDGVQPIIYHLSADFPEYLIEETYEMADNWNDVFKDTVSWMLFWDLKDDENGGMYFTRYCEADADCSATAATLSKVVNLPEKGLTLVVHNDAEGNAAAIQTSDGNYPAEYSGKALARFVNALPGSGSVDFSAGGATVAAGVGYDLNANYESYTVMDPAKVTVSASTGDELTNVDIKAGHVYLFVLAEGAVLSAESSLQATQGEVTGDQGIRVVNAMAGSEPQNMTINGSRRAGSIAFGDNSGFAAPGYNGAHTVAVLGETSRQDTTCYHKDGIGRCVGSKPELAAGELDSREVLKQEMPDMYVLCQNKYQGDSCEGREGDKSDLSDCRYTHISSQAIKVNPCRDDVPRPNSLKKVGDARYNLVYYVREAQSSSPLGYGPSAHDPDTGEIYYAAANIYGSALTTYSQYTADIVNLLNGDLEVDDTITGRYIRDFLDSMNFEEGESLFQKREGALSMEDEHGHLDHRHAPMKAAKTPATTDAFLSLLKSQTLAPSTPPSPVDRKELHRFANDKSYRTKLVREVVDGFASPEQLEARLSKIAGTPIEQIMITNEVKLAMSNGQLQPGDMLEAEDIANLSPLAWATQSRVNAEKERMKKLVNSANGCIYMADFLDDAVYGLAKEYKDAGLSGESLRIALEKTIYGGVIEHEVGHTIGLRHNFSGSNDLFNFKDEYYDIRERELVPCQNDNWCDAGSGESCVEIPCQSNDDCGAQLTCTAEQKCIDENETEYGFCHAMVERSVPCSSCPGGTVCDDTTGACAQQRACAATPDCLQGESCESGLCSLDGVAVNTPYTQSFQEPVRKLTPRPYMTESEVINRRTEYQYSTVMDYGGRFNSDLHGLGKYDYAAIKAGYGGLVEVYEDTTRFRKYVDDLATFYGYPPAQFGSYLNTENWKTAGTIFSAFNYLESYIGVEENKKRLTVPWEQVRYEHEMTQTYQREAYDWTYIEVPYSACYDEYRGNMGCYYFDTGVDIGEMVHHAMNSLQYYYLFDAFKRERFSFAQYGNPAYYYSRILDRYMNPLGDAGMYYALYYHIFKDYLWFANWKDSPFEGRTLRLASETSFQYLVDLMASPAPGSHSFDPETNRYENTSYEIGENGSDLDIPVGVGKFPYTQFQPNGGYYDFQHSLWIGSFWEKIAALLTITDSTAYFTSNFVSELGTGGGSSIGFNTIYQVELTNVLGGIIADELSLYAGVKEPADNSFRNRRVIGPVLEEAGQDLVAPSISNLSFKIWVAAYGLSFLPAGFDPTFVDSLAIYFDGNASEFATNSEVNQVVFEDPFGLKTYVALTNNYSYVDQYGQQRAPFSTAAKVIEKANIAKGNWEAAIASGNTAAIAAAEQEVKNTVQILNYLRQLNDKLGSFYF